MKTEESRQKFFSDFKTESTFYEIAFNHSLTGIIFADTAGCILECNPAIEKMYQYRKSKLVGKSIFDFMSPHSVEQYKSTLDSMTRDKNYEEEVQIIRSDGRFLEIWRQTSLLEMGENRPPALMLVEQDITENWIKEELLHLQGTALEAAANSILITNLRGDIVWINSAFTELTGYADEDIIYKNARILNSGRQDKDFWQKLWNTILSGKVWHGEIINQKKNGDVYFEEQTITPVYNRQDEITHFIAVKQDITERKEKEKELLESNFKNEVLAYIINHSPAISFLWKSDDQWTVEFVSDNIRQYGYTADLFYNEEIHYKDIVHPDDFIFINNEIKRIINEGIEFFRHTYRIFNKSRELRWVDDHILLRLDAEGNVTHYQGIILDVTEQKLIETELFREKEFLRTVLRHIQDGIIACDHLGKITLMNPAAIEFFGQNVTQDFNDLTFDKIKILDNNNEIITSENSPLSRALRGEKLKNLEVIFETENNKKLTILNDGQQLLNSQGEMVGAVLVMHDITARKLAEEKEKLHQEQLIQADKMVALGTLVSGVAHEINNPNNFVMLNIPILEKSWTSVIPILDKHFEENGDFFVGNRLKYSKIRESIPVLLKGITEGSNRIKNIVKELKDFARKETSDLDQTIDVNEVVKAAITLTSNLIKKSTMDFTINYGENIPKIKGNFQRLEQVVINLIENSCQALNNNEQAILIKTTSETENNTVIIEVADEGIGMNQYTMKEIFDPFFTTKRDIGGTGLGLSVSSNIIMNHKGSLEYESEPGKGTKAFIRLPVSREN